MFRIKDQTFTILLAVCAAAYAILSIMLDPATYKQSKSKK